MRKRTTVKIDKKEYTVKELTVREIISLLTENKLLAGSDSEAGDNAEAGISGIFAKALGITGYVRQMIELSVENLTIEDMVDMAPSELGELYTAFKEVNNHFFEMAQTLELGDQVTLMARELLKEFSTQLIDLSKRAIQESGTTDTVS